MNTEIMIDTVQMRTHTELLRQEYSYAQELCDRLKYIRTHSDDYELCSQLAPLIKKAEYLSQHCVLMREALEETCDIFEHFSKEVSRILNDYITCNAPNLE